MEMATVRAYRSHNDGHFPIKSTSWPIIHSISRGSHCAPRREPPDVALPMWRCFDIFPVWGPYLVHQSPQWEVLIHSVLHPGKKLEAALIVVLVAMRWHQNLHEHVQSDHGHTWLLTKLSRKSHWKVKTLVRMKLFVDWLADSDQAWEGSQAC